MIFSMPLRSRVRAALFASALVAGLGVAPALAQDAPPPSATPTTRPAATQPSSRSSSQPSPRDQGERLDPHSFFEPPRIDIKPLPFIPRPGVVSHITPPELVFAQPDTLDELRSLERVVEETAKKITPATVCLQIAQASGSGVIVSADGWILTAGHVSDDVGHAVTIILQDGRRVHGVTYGANRGVDSGLVRITDPGPWPYARIGTSNDLQIGQWLIAVGHPGGYKVGRAPVVRLGRLISISKDGNTLTTDNTLVGGDSGGPLFDLDGRVVGINSRISTSVADNMHVSVDVFMRDWDRIAAGEVWGILGGPSPLPTPSARLPYLGIGSFELAEDGLKITLVVPRSPVASAGLQSGDILTKADNRLIRSQTDLVTALMAKTPGQTMSLDILRDGKPLTLQVVLTAPSTQPSRPLPRPLPRPRP